MGADDNEVSLTFVGGELARLTGAPLAELLRRERGLINRLAEFCLEAGVVLPRRLLDLGL